MSCSPLPSPVSAVSPALCASGLGLNTSTLAAATRVNGVTNSIHSINLVQRSVGSESEYSAGLALRVYSQMHSRELLFVLMQLPAVQSSNTRTILPLNRCTNLSLWSCMSTSEYVHSCRRWLPCPLTPEARQYPADSHELVASGSCAYRRRIIPRGEVAMRHVRIAEVRLLEVRDCLAGTVSEPLIVSCGADVTQL